MENFAQVLRAEIPPLRRYARAVTRDIELADDLVQSCLTRAIAKQHLWQPNSDLRAWLFTILHNEHVNYVRRSARSPNTVPIDTATPLGSVKPAALDVLELRDLSTAIGKLRDEEREALLLVGLEGICYNEAASILGIPVGTVRSRLSRGRDQLRILMGIKETPWRVRAVHRPADARARQKGRLEPRLGKHTPCRRRSCQASEILAPKVPATAGAIRLTGIG